MPIQRISRHTVYESPWVKLYLERLEYPNGTIIDPYHILEFDKHGVAVILENNLGQIAFSKPSSCVGFQNPRFGN